MRVKKPNFFEKTSYPAFSYWKKIFGLASTSIAEKLVGLLKMWK
jgi:hypothetical protein